MGHFDGNMSDSNVATIGSLRLGKTIKFMSSRAEANLGVGNKSRTKPLIGEPQLPSVFCNPEYDARSFKSPAACPSVEGLEKIEYQFVCSFALFTDFQSLF